MRSIQELEAIRESTLENMTLRKEHNGTRIVVGMATCGIAAGARGVLTAFMEELAERKLIHVALTQMGCIGMCHLEPIVEVHQPGHETGYIRKGNAGHGALHSARAYRGRKPH